MMDVRRTPRALRAGLRALAWVATGLGCANALAGNPEIPPVVAAFPTELSCTPGQLLWRQVGLGRTTNIIYHNGRLYSNSVTGFGRREYVFSDPSDPTSFTIVHDDDALVPALADQGNHSHTKIGDYAGGYWGITLRRIAPGINGTDNNLEWFGNQQPYPEGSGGHLMYYPWSIPFNWLQYGPTPGEARLWRANRLLASWNPLAEHGVAGTSILVGNILLIVSDASNLGVLAYDIGPTFQDPPQNPALLDKFTGPVGAYIAGIWENYLVLSGSGNQSQVFVIDFSDPTSLALVATIDVTGTPALDAGTNVPYVQTQDQFVFTRRLKIDMESLQPVLELDEVGAARPPGGVGGELDVSQYMLPLGQFLITGAYSSEGRDGVGVWCHQATPDRRAPYIGYHIPRSGQTGYPVGAPISLVIAEELESFTIINGVTVSVRPIGGAPVDAWTSFAHDGVLTITPKEYLAADTTYEVEVVAGGIKDVSGNGIDAYRFTFSTGGSVVGGNASPTIASFDATAGPVAPGASVTYVTVASDAEADALEYRYSFGDGTPATAWGSNSSVTHSFAATGHFPVKVQVRDLKPDGSTSVVSEILTTTVAAPPPAAPPTHSSTLALGANRKIWVVNPDNDSVSRIHADTRAVEADINLGALLGTGGAVHPTSIAVAGSGEVWITARNADRVMVLSAAGQLLTSIDTGYGSAPQAVAISQDGARAYVTLGGRGATNPTNGQLVRFSTATRAEVGRVELGPTARAIALTADARRIFVSRLISLEHSGEIWEVDGDAMTLTRTIPLFRDRGLSGLDSGGPDGPGVPNYITGLVLSPQQDWLWYTAIKTDTNRGLFFRQDGTANLPLNHDSTVRSVLGRVDLSGPVPVEPGRSSVGEGRARVDVDNSDSPSALVFTPRGDYAFVALQGNDTVGVFDDLAIRQGGGQSSTWRFGVGAAPQGLLWDPATDNLWSQNLMGRSVSVHPLAAFVGSGNREASRQDIATGGTELLPPSVLAGKRQFYFAGDRSDGQNAMSFEGYMSCASCHLDGGHDGRTWDFTQRGEGLRNTSTLHGRAGMVHGNVHWTGNFDEIEDFILDIVNQFGGTGFLAPGEMPNPPLGSPNGGRSELLDAIGDYVASLGDASLPRSPHRSANGQLSADASAGAAVFGSQQCAACHLPAQGFTDSTLGTATLHDVGTLRTSSGSRLGEALDGIDTPGLHGIWASAPYFHDGSAESLDAVFQVAGGTTLQAELASFGGTAQMPGFLDINYDSSSHGQMVVLGGVGDSVTFSNVDGGPGGMGAIEMRYWPASPGTLRLSVNGNTVGDLVFPQELTHFEWKRGLYQNVLLNAGPTNTVTLSLQAVGSWQDIGLDEITVSTAAELQRAEAHRRAGDLGATELARLKAYLLQLDGRNAGGVLPGMDLMFRNGFE